MFSSLCQHTGDFVLWRPYVHSLQKIIQCSKAFVQQWPWNHLVALHAWYLKLIGLFNLKQLCSPHQNKTVNLDQKWMPHHPVLLNQISWIAFQDILPCEDLGLEWGLLCLLSCIHRPSCFISILHALVKLAYVGIWIGLKFSICLSLLLNYWLIHRSMRWQLSDIYDIERPNVLGVLFIWP